MRVQGSGFRVQGSTGSGGGFAVFDDYLGQCKFSTCAHINDKGCKIVEAVKNGDIVSSRHDSYVTMYNEVKDIKDWQL